MPKTLDDELRDLSAKYNAAYSAHQVLAMAVAEFAMSGDRPPDLLQDSEKEAALELAKVAAELRAAMAELAERTVTERSDSVHETKASTGVVTSLKRRSARR